MSNGTGQEIQKYGSYDIEKAEEEQKQLDSEGGGDFYKMKVGRNVLRFLPPPAGQKTPFVVAYQHYVDVPGAQGPVSFVCPRMMAKKPCPACAKAEELRRTGNPADSELANRLTPRRRVFANVIDRKEPDRGVQIAAFGKQIHEQLVGLRRDPDAGGDFTDPQGGFDIVIERTGTGRLDTEYKVYAARRQSPLGNPDWIEQQFGLQRYASPKSAQEIMNLLSGVAAGTTGGAVAPTSGGAPRGSRAQDMVEDDTEATEDDDQPFAPPPRRGR